MPSIFLPTGPSSAVLIGGTLRLCGVGPLGDGESDTTNGDLYWNLNLLDPSWTILSAVASFQAGCTDSITQTTDGDVTTALIEGGSLNGYVRNDFFLGNILIQTDETESASWVQANAGNGDAFYGTVSFQADCLHGYNVPGTAGSYFFLDAVGLLVEYEIPEWEGEPADDEDEPPPPPPDPVEDYGVDLCSHLLGLTVIYRDPADADIKTQTTTNYGASWYTATVATDAGGYPIAPCLAVTRHEDLFAAWHDASDRLRVHRSRDYARTWEEIVPSPIRYGRYPRLLITQDRQFMFFYSTGAGAGRLYESTDYYETIRRIQNFPTDQQMVSASVDRRGRLHVLAEDGGTIVQFTSWDGVDWEGPDSFIGGREGPAGCAYWLHAGAVLAWNTGDLLQLYRTDSGFIDIADGPFDVTSAYPQQAPGVCFDRHGRLFIALQAVGGFAIETAVNVVAQVAPDLPDIPRLALDTEP